MIKKGKRVWILGLNRRVLRLTKTVIWTINLWEHILRSLLMFLRILSNCSAIIVLRKLHFVSKTINSHLFMLLAAVNLSSFSALKPCNLNNIIFLFTQLLFLIIMRGYSKLLGFFENEIKFSKNLYNETINNIIKYFKLIFSLTQNNIKKKLFYILLHTVIASLIFFTILMFSKNFN